MAKISDLYKTQNIIFGRIYCFTNFMIVDNTQISKFLEFRYICTDFDNGV